MNIRKNTTITAIVGGIIVTLLLVGGTIWMGENAGKDTREAVRSVSLLYLDELAGRREQVVEDNLHDKIHTIEVAIELMSADDLSDKQHFEAYQTRMKRLYNLERFAFVDTDGLIYTSTGTEDNIQDYAFDHKTLSSPEISVFDPGSSDRRVIIAVPVDLTFQGKRLSVCFMAISMEEMLSGVSMTTNTGGATFCNLYTKDGIALTDAVLGGLAEEDNLLDAMQIAVFEQPYSYETFTQTFQNNERGVVSFSYNGIQETLAYIPVSGTDWQLTYLIRESVISGRIGPISNGTVRRSILQSFLTIASMLAVFGFIIDQIRKNSAYVLESETREAENRVKQEQLEERIKLQDQLLQETQHRKEQDYMISALSSDYWSVYYLQLKEDKGVCYRSHSDLKDGLKVGERFDYLERMTAYGKQYVVDSYREEFLHFIQPETIIEGLKNRPVISHTYMVSRNGRQSYESIRFARVDSPEDNDESNVHDVGACFVNVDEEVRDTMAQRQTLSDALTAAEEANKAKTAFLSNMSHEIRTPMNAIIGLDSLALHNKDLPEETRGYLEKINDSAKHLLGLINDILDMSRIESGRLALRQEEFSLRNMLEQINTMVMAQCSEKGLRYECNVIGGVSDYYIGDDMKLKQVLINILSNAIKFTDAPGDVTLTVERTASYENQTTIRFSIKDTGIGMDESFLPKIFDSFTQENSSRSNKYGSTGLGMAITKNIVELMNGKIDVESEKGVGSLFTVVLTLKNSEHQEPVDTFIQPKDMKVLVVDDEEVAAEHARIVLDEAGIRSDSCFSGKEALRMLEIAHTKNDPYNLVLLDWKMPEMDGIEVAKQIREKYDRETTVIILTSFNWDEIMDEGLHAGVDSFLAKPLFASNVIEEFERIARKNDLTLSSQKKRADLKGRHILLAEDILINAEIIKEILKMKGIVVDHAENGKIVTEMFERSEPGYYDAILMDVQMPQMNGLQAAAAIRSMDREDAQRIPIIALTANAFDEDVQRSLQVGMNAHLSKPVEPEHLYQTLEELIWEAGSHGSERHKEVIL